MLEDDTWRQVLSLDILDERLAAAVILIWKGQQEEKAKVMDGVAYRDMYVWVQEFSHQIDLKLESS